MKIQRTYFNPKAIKDLKTMGFNKFKSIYSGILRGDLKEIYEKLTGEKVKARKPKKESE